MPRIARFRITAIGELHRQLQYAPRETRRRQMDAAEQLLGDIDARRTYPEDYVVFRITGYRPETIGESPLTFVGEALLSDLAIFIQRLSRGLHLQADHAGREAVTMEQINAQLNVSVKTLQRYRRQGLVCHYVSFPDDPHGRMRLACFKDALERFIQRHRARVRRARDFSRVAESDQQRIINDARRLHESRRVSLNEAALRLSRKHGRAHETIRGMLRRHDRRADEPIFAEHGPLSQRDGRLIHRAHKWGVSIRQLAERFNKTQTTIRRALNRRRGELLSRLHVTWIDLPTFLREDAEKVILSAPAVTADLDALLPALDALVLIEAAHRAPEPDEQIEHALVAGYNILKRRAELSIDAVDPWPAAAALDAVETDLRWAVLLKRRLMSLGLPTAIMRIEQNLHRPLISQPARQVTTMLGWGVSVVSDTIETLDPGKDQRLARRVAYAMDRVLAERGDVEAALIAGRAAARHEPQAIPTPAIYTGITPWDEMLSLREDLMAHLPALDEQLAETLQRRYGLRSSPPLTFAQLAASMAVSKAAAMRLVRRAELKLRTLAAQHRNH